MAIEDDDDEVIEQDSHDWRPVVVVLIIAVSFWGLADTMAKVFAIPGC